jgi:hypothetical protein
MKTEFLMFHGIDSLRKRGFNRASLLIKIYFSNDVKMTYTSSLVMLLTIVVTKLYYLAMFPTERFSWIGVRRISNFQCDARFNTIPFDLIYSNWMLSYPAATGDCAMLRSTDAFKWKNILCTYKRYFTCTMVRLIPSKKDNKI